MKIRMIKNYGATSDGYWLEAGRSYELEELDIETAGIVMNRGLAELEEKNETASIAPPETRKRAPRKRTQKEA